MVSSDQPGGSQGDNAQNMNQDSYIKSLRQQLHEKEKQLLEKDSIISVLKKKDQPPSPSQEDGSIDVVEAVQQETLKEEIDEEARETAGEEDVGASTQSDGSNVAVTWADFLQAAKQMHAKNKQFVSKPTWYSPPAQRIRWGGDQSLQHVDWGDLFFDLFYVAAVYNLGVLGLSGFTTGEHLRSAIYFLGSLGPLWSCWQFHVSLLGTHFLG